MLHFNNASLHSLLDKPRFMVLVLLPGVGIFLNMKVGLFFCICLHFDDDENGKIFIKVIKTKNNLPHQNNFLKIMR